LQWLDVRKSIILDSSEPGKRAPVACGGRDARGSSLAGSRAGRAQAEVGGGAVARALKRGREELGYETALWTSARVADLIERECPRDLSQLSRTAVRCLRRMRRRPALVAAFWRQAGLFEASL